VFTRATEKVEFVRQTTVAGVYPQGFWNPVDGISWTKETFRDNKGSVVDLTVSDVKQLPWSAAYRGESSSQDGQILSLAGWFNTKQITIEGIPYERYDLVLITPGGKEAKDPLEMVVAVGGRTKVAKTVRLPSDFAGRYIEETEEHPEGNYLVFRGLTGPKQTIRLPKPTKGKRPCVPAVQIIKR
jgi:hypothetical protein